MCAEMSCLMDALQDKRVRLQPECKKRLQDRIDMWSYAAKVAVLFFGGGGGAWSRGDVSLRSDVTKSRPCDILAHPRVTMLQ